LLSNGHPLDTCGFQVVDAAEVCLWRSIVAV